MIDYKYVHLIFDNGIEIEGELYVIDDEFEKRVEPIDFNIYLPEELEDRENEIRKLIYDNLDLIMEISNKHYKYSWNEFLKKTK